MSVETKLNKKKFTLVDNFESSTDPIRNDLENYYKFSEKESGIFLESARGGEEIVDLVRGEGTIIKYYGQHATYSIISSGFTNKATTSSPINTLIQKFNMYIDFNTPDKDFISSKISGGPIYDDSYFDAGAPIEYVSNVDNKSLLRGDVEYKYNYGSASYESTIEAVEYSALPNFYEILPKYFKNRRYEEIVGAESVKDYIISETQYVNSSAKLINAEDFPFCVNISFDNPKFSEEIVQLNDQTIRDSIVENDLSCLFCDVLNTLQSQKISPMIDSENYEKDLAYANSGLISQYKSGTRQEEFIENYNSSQVEIEKIDVSSMLELINKMIDMLDFSKADEVKSLRKIYRGNLDSEKNVVDLLTSEPDSTRWEYAETVNSLNDLTDELQNVVNEKSRNILDILNGVKPYSSDVLFYSIEKSETPSSIPLQRFWIPSSKIYTGLNYIDTQIKYGDEYTYQVYAYKICLDTEIRYVPGWDTPVELPPEEKEFDPTAGGLAVKTTTEEEEKSAFDLAVESGRIIKNSVTTRNFLKLVKIPYFKSEGMIIDNPPISPDFEFVTYRGKKNRLSVFFRSGQGSFTTTPIKFTLQEEDYFKNLRKARKLNDFQPIEFVSDDPENSARIFEIRRLTSPPLSIEDFKESTRNAVATPYGDGLLADSASFNDEVEPNKKYYYIFRSIDKRGNYSNASFIYEVEIVENSGAVYPIIKQYDIPEKQKNTTKNLKRLFNVVPRLKQVLPSSSNPLKMGSEKVPLFGKTFKLRMTSRKTGKVVDLNIEFVEDRPIE